MYFHFSLIYPLIEQQKQKESNHLYVTKNVILWFSVCQFLNCCVWSVPNKVTVTQEPNWPQMYSSETVTLRCVIEGGEESKWTYEWSPVGFNTSPTNSEYRISNVSTSHKRNYICRGKKDYLSTDWSKNYFLNISGKLYVVRPHEKVSSVFKLTRKLPLNISELSSVSVGLETWSLLVSDDDDNVSYRTTFQCTKWTKGHFHHDCNTGSELQHIRNNDC